MGWERAVGIVLLVAVLGTSCGSTEKGASEPVGVTASGAVPSNRVIGFADAMYGVEGWPLREDQRLVRAGADGAFSEIELPGAEGRLNFGLEGPLVHGRTLTIIGREVEEIPMARTGMALPSGALHVWTTTDGRRWEQGPSIPDANGFGIPNVLEADGVLLMGVTGNDGTFQLWRRDTSGVWQRATSDLPTVAGADGPVGAGAHLGAVWVERGELVGLVSFSGDGTYDPAPWLIRSSDRGRSWAAEACPPDPGDPCGDAGITADGLLLRGGRSSTDGGRTWSPISLRPPDAPECTPTRFQSVTATGDGWTAVGSIEPAGGQMVLTLLHSADGVTWDRTAGLEPCDALDVSWTAYTEPVGFGGRWWTIETTSPVDESGPARVLASDDGASWSPEPMAAFATKQSARLVVVDDRLLVPVIDDRSQLVELRSVSGP